MRFFIAEVGIAVDAGRLLTVALLDGVGLIECGCDGVGAGDNDGDCDGSGATDWQLTNRNSTEINNETFVRITTPPLIRR